MFTVIYKYPDNNWEAVIAPGIQASTSSDIPNKIITPTRSAHIDIKHDDNEIKRLVASEKDSMLVIHEVGVVGPEDKKVFKTGKRLSRSIIAKIAGLHIDEAIKY